MRESTSTDVVNPMFLAAPGVLTRIAPRIRRPFGNILFAHSDSEGDVSTYGGALQAANRVSNEAKVVLASTKSRFFGPLRCARNDSNLKMSS